MQFLSLGKLATYAHSLWSAFSCRTPPGGGFPTEGFLKVRQFSVLSMLLRARLCVLCPLALLLPHSEPSLQTAPTGNEPSKFQMNADLVVLYWQCTNAGVSLGSVQSGKCTCLCLLVLIETATCLSCSLG